MGLKNGTFQEENCQKNKKERKKKIFLKKKKSQ